MRRLFTLFLCLLPTLASANDWSALEKPGAIAIMRHALAPGTGDPDRFEIDDCSTQRNLDDRGRAQAQAIGAAFRSRGILFDRVLTSQWCRCRDTATLLDIGPVTEAPFLNSFFADRSTAANQARDTRQAIGTADGRMMLVTHQVNITALTGVYPKSGEVIVIRVEDGAVEVLGRIVIAP